jgi:hypothetical protein
MLGYRMDDWGFEVQFLASARDSALLCSMQAGCGVYPASYTVGTGGCFPGSKVAGA